MEDSYADKTKAAEKSAEYLQKMLHICKWNWETGISSSIVKLPLN